ncbi:hypothetical protein D3C84_1074180 [compost metagenome]
MRSKAVQVVRHHDALPRSVFDDPERAKFAHIGSAGAAFLAAVNGGRQRQAQSRLGLAQETGAFKDQFGESLKRVAQLWATLATVAHR